MGEAGAMGRRRPFPGAPRQRWWRQQHPQRRRQCWWPCCGEGEGAGRTAMGLAGLQENVFAGQSKIYAYMSSNKCSGIRSPLQEENSVAHYEVKCPGKPLAGIYRKQEEKRNAGNVIRSAVKSDEQKSSPLAPFPNQKSKATEPPKTPPPSHDSTNVAVAKQALQKHLKASRPLGKSLKGKPSRIENSQISTLSEGAPGRAKLNCSLKKGRK